jgi:hypothetical protein
MRPAFYRDGAMRRFHKEKVQLLFVLSEGNDPDRIWSIENALRDILPTLGPVFGEQSARIGNLAHGRWWQTTGIQSEPPRSRCTHEASGSLPPSAARPLSGPVLLSLVLGGRRAFSMAQHGGRCRSNEYGRARNSLGFAIAIRTTVVLIRLRAPIPAFFCKRGAPLEIALVDSSDAWYPPHEGPLSTQSGHSREFVCAFMLLPA